ncbi:unnamed protein product, partial [marine sediment metagenome]
LELRNGSQFIKLEIEDRFSKNEKDRIESWLIHSADALKLAYGQWPSDYFLVNVTVGTSESSPVPWGQVNRGKYPSVSLVVDPRSTLHDLREDWTIYHELSHLLIPYEGGGDLWFSEGLASYYQNILQARAGMLDERYMWQKLYNGFERGRKQSFLSIFTLSRLSDQIRINHHYMRIYWSGALFWLEADVALRRLNKGMTLDKALLELKKCCHKKSLSPLEISVKLDEISKTKHFTRLFEKYTKSRRIPAYDSLLSSLGVTINDGKVKLSDDSRLSPVRN